MDFDVVPYHDIVWGKRLGAGSFGSVFKGSYLGIDIAIKEVLPSTEYDVHKYFEREWRIMRECRHPNIVLFLGLSKAADDGRVFIISEFVPRGNLRHFILSSHPFPWRLRLSFATDVARAVAYLHARQCIHRDLKGENLLITSNDRIKVTDFGFARIASRNAEEMKRMTYCGTDGYMSPEIINGFDFDLPTDVFSLGVIFIEILSRRLVDSKTFTRQAPSFTPDPIEVYRRASRNCPPALITLALDCCREDPNARPKMPEVLSRLREIEVEVLNRLPEEDAEHVGSIRLIRQGKRAMPIFDMPPVASPGGIAKKEEEAEESDKKMEEDALVALAGLKVDGKGPTVEGGATTPVTGVGGGDETWRTARWKEDPASPKSVYTDASEANIPTPDAASSSFLIGESTSDIMKTPTLPQHAPSKLRAASPMDDTSSMLTLKGATSPPKETAHTAIARTTGLNLDIPPYRATSPSPKAGSPLTPLAAVPSPTTPTAVNANPIPRAASPRLQTKAEKADEEAAKNAPPPAVGTHRFTLVDKEALQLLSGKKLSSFPSTFAAFLPKALAPSNKCPVCHKRLGSRPALQCDDCSIIVHVKCSHATERDCPGDDGQKLVDPPNPAES